VSVLRTVLEQDGCARFVGVHDGLTAGLVEEAGFEGAWVSGLGVSSSYRVPDAGLLTMTEFVGAAVQVRRACTLPIISDVDAGFGDVNVVQRMVGLYETSGVDAICMEDKQGPKRNSFRDGTELADPGEFAEKIAAAKAAQQSAEFVVVARLESLIIGAGMADAVNRAQRYHDAGADALLIHSRASDAGEIEQFAREWRDTGRGLPLIAIPTTYHSVTVGELTAMGVSVAIYANQLIRASTRASRELLESIDKFGSSTHAEETLDSLQALFDLVGMDRVKGDRAWQGLMTTRG
jgi:phosphoenolpyruvate phosphomutase